MADFPERCAVSEQCLPDVLPRAQLSLLHAEMLHEIGMLRAARRPLTDSQIWELSRTTWHHKEGWNFTFARAVEAAHGIWDEP